MTELLAPSPTPPALRPKAVWLFGRPGCGKTTLARGLDAKLRERGLRTALLDGDELRTGLNRDLGFSDRDRDENLRRAAEVAGLFLQAGVTPVCAFITPLREHRALVRSILGHENLIQVHLAATLATCRRRDPKGHYARAENGSMPLFTGVDSPFDETDDQADAVIDTQRFPPDLSVDLLLALVLARQRSWTEPGRAWSRTPFGR